MPFPYQVLPYQVLPYHKDQLFALLSEKSRASLTDVKLKLHSTYFEGYFNGIGAKTIVVENDYIDRDYLEDFCSYYVKCFQDYNRKCTRLHFFRNDFSADSFDCIIQGNSSSVLDELKEGYLGFIVVKPLPKTIIGRTCLKNYPEENGRHFPVSRKYQINLFGLDLCINTLAYQEQDQVAAACATSALWSIFQRTGMLFHHQIPTPIEITKSATYNFPAQQRHFPNHGLTMEQMAHAIRNVGLEPYPVDVNNADFILKSTIYSYLKAGIPLALGVRLNDMSTSTPMLIGLHAVAVTGFCISENDPEPLHGTGFLLHATRMNKIYVHDDQVGPFARMNFDGVTIHAAFSLTTSWKGRSGAIGSARAVPTTILIPLYHKIRIPYEHVEKVVIDFDSLIELFRTNQFIPLSSRPQWDIHLSASNDLKQEILAHPSLISTHRKKILTESMPRFVWRAKASVDNKEIIELLFDATDIEQGKFFLRAVLYDQCFSEVLKLLCNQTPIKKIIDASKSCAIFEWIIESGNSL